VIFGSDFLRLVGVDSYVSTKNRELSAFQREQLVDMRRAAKYVRDSERSLLRGGTVLKVGPDRKDKSRKHLYQLVRYRVSRTQIDVMAVIDFGKGFYGRFHETGLDVTTKGRTVGRRFTGRRVIRRRGRPYRFLLPKRQTLAPTAARTTPEVISILGNSYEVLS
jgi:hypothetical protein